MHFLCKNPNDKDFSDTYALQLKLDGPFGMNDPKLSTLQ